jgi:orotidine-5'-phosphate decarboxylase
MGTFGERLHDALHKRGPLCVGIDPHPELLRAWGLTDDVYGLESFSNTVVEALGSEVAVFKPQSAFFERHGASGIGVLESTIRHLRRAGALVLLDVKRGDIGSTVQAYADAYLDPSSPLCADAITASPYLGFGSLRPMIDKALAYGNGVFVLALTSNPEGASVQRARGADGRTVGQTVVDEISLLNDGAYPLGSIGAVVGVTVDGGLLDLTSINGPLLAPGLGAQGGTPAALRNVFGSNLSAVVPSISREVLAAGPDPASLRAAAGAALSACRDALAGTPGDQVRPRVDPGVAETGVDR